MLLEIIGTIVGLLYLWLEYKASIYLWIVGIIMPAIYIFVFFDAGLYADFAINVYYLLAAVYGWVMWKKSKYVQITTDGGKYEEMREREDMQPFKSLFSAYSVYRKLIFKLLITFILLFVAIAWILILFTDSDVPWFNAFNTSLSVIGMWMLAKKYIEQWWIWIVADVACAALYAYKDLHFTAVLYAFYAIIAIFGYRKWKAMLRKADNR